MKSAFNPQIYSGFSIESLEWEEKTFEFRSLLADEYALHIILILVLLSFHTGEMKISRRRFVKGMREKLNFSIARLSFWLIDMRWENSIAKIKNSLISHFRAIESRFFENVCALAGEEKIIKSLYAFIISLLVEE